MSVMLSCIFTNCLQRITNIGLVVIIHNQGMRITSQNRTQVYGKLVDELGGSSLEDDKNIFRSRKCATSQVGTSHAVAGREKDS